MENTKRNTWGGSRAGAGRRRRATAQRNGRVYVALDKVRRVMIGDVYFATGRTGEWWVDNDKYTDFAAAAAEFVRRVNEAQ